MTVAKAQAHLAQSKRVLTEAQQAHDRALDLLDAALAEIGWHRLSVIQSPGAERLFSNIAYPNSTLTAAEIAALVEQQKRALA